MNILVTGSNGFIGKNLIEALNRLDGVKIITFEKEDAIESLTEKVKSSDFIFHLAGINRPKSKKEFYKGNSDLTKLIVDLVKISGNI